MSSRHDAIVFLVFLAGIVPLALVVDRPIHDLPVVPLAFASDLGLCSPEDESVHLLPQAPMSLYNNGMIRFLPCVPGELEIALRGSTANGRGAHALVSQQGTNVWEGLVSDTEIIRASVVGGSWVTIAFINDASDGRGERNLWLDQLSFAPR